MADMDDKSEAPETKNGEAVSAAPKPRARRASSKSAAPAEEAVAPKSDEAAAPKPKRPRAKAASGGTTRKAAPKPSARSSRPGKSAKPKAKASSATSRGTSAKWIGLGSAAAIGSAAVAAAVLYSKRSKPEPSKVPPSTKDEEAGGD